MITPVMKCCRWRHREVHQDGCHAPAGRNLHSPRPGLRYLEAVALGIVRNLYDRIGKKIEALAGQVRMRGITLDSHGLGDAALVGQLRELNSMYSRLSILTFADGVPPFQAYLELCTLVGQLSLFGPTHRPPELPRYDHDDLGGCFYRVKRYLDELLSLMVEPGYKERPFIGTGSRMQVVLETSWLEPVWELYIGVQSALTPEECIQLADGTRPTGHEDRQCGTSGIHLPPGTGWLAVHSPLAAAAPPAQLRRALSISRSAASRRASNGSTSTRRRPSLSA